jgi:hypothetical protein
MIGWLPTSSLFLRIGKREISHRFLPLQGVLTLSTRDSRTLRFKVIQALSEAVSSTLNATTEAETISRCGCFLEQLCSIAAIILKLTDFDHISRILGSIQASKT